MIFTRIRMWFWYGMANNLYRMSSFCMRHAMDIGNRVVKDMQTKYGTSTAKAVRDAQRNTFH